MNETVTTERARELLARIGRVPDESLAHREITMARDLIAEALAGRERIAELAASLAAASYLGHYISTACQGGLHDLCRRNSKWSGEPCLCGCGHDQAKAKPTYQELTASLGAARAELAAIKGNVTKAPHAKECAIAEWELRAWAYGRGHGPKPPDKPACNCWKAGPWTTAEPRAGEMTKGQK